MVFFLGLLKVVHFFALFLGGGSAFGMAVIGMTAPTVSTEHHQTLAAMAKKFKIISHTAIGLLLLSGLLMVILGGYFPGVSAWFWVKMLALAVLIFGIIQAGKFAAIALEGDAAAGARAEMFGKMNIAALVVILIAAVLAFG